MSTQWAAASSNTILEMRSITKEFPGVKALSDVSITVRAGEIHAICGENGAGKSTLMKVLSGVYPSGTYAGEIIYKGESVHFTDIRSSEARRHRDHPPGARADSRAVDHREHLPRQRADASTARSTGSRPRSEALELLARVGLEEDPGHPDQAHRRRQAAARRDRQGARKDVKLLILDEPTAALNEADSQHLLDLIRGLKGKGHHLDHDLAQAQRDRAGRRLDHDHPRRPDHRDARRQGRRRQRGPDHSRAWSAASLESRFPDAHAAHRRGLLRGPRLDRPAPAGPPSGWSCKNSNFTVRRGEIVGFAGLMGAGRTELAMSIFGRSYGIFISGRDLQGRRGDPAQERLGRDRPRPRLRQRGPQGARAQPARRHQAVHRRRQAVEDLRRTASSTRSRSTRAPRRTARACASRPRASTRACASSRAATSRRSSWRSGCSPTRTCSSSTSRPGASTSAPSTRSTASSRRLAAQGKGVIVISSELPELLGLTDRIYTVFEGPSPAISRRPTPTRRPS